MKTTTKFALVLAAAFAAAPVAQASADTIPGWYAGLGAGMNFQNDTRQQTPGVPNFEFSSPGFDILGSYGYAWDSGLRLEGEAFHSNADIDHGDGSMNNTDLFANVLYDINLKSMHTPFEIGSYFTPYIGAGIGVDFVDAENIGPIPVGSAGVTHIHDDSTRLAYQGIAGLAAQLDNEWSITADYRYIASLDPKFTSDAAATKAKFENISHNIIIGVRYNLDAPSEVKPRMTEAPRMQQKMATRQPVAPIPQTFQVFFDYDKADLTPEAKRIIASAAAEYKKGGYVRVMVTGHTDTKGTMTYNMRLSERRANAVKAEFARLGVDNSAVAAKGVGKEGLLVPTNDQVREAQNRRAEIVLDKQQ